MSIFCQKITEIDSVGGRQVRSDIEHTCYVIRFSPLRPLSTIEIVPISMISTARLDWTKHPAVGRTDLKLKARSFCKIKYFY
jgi:hypothetical protein